MICASNVLQLSPSSPPGIHSHHHTILPTLRHATSKAPLQGTPRGVRYLAGLAMRWRQSCLVPLPRPAQSVFGIANPTPRVEQGARPTCSPQLLSQLMAKLVIPVRNRSSTSKGKTRRRGGGRDGGRRRRRRRVFDGQKRAERRSKRLYQLTTRAAERKPSQAFQNASVTRRGTLNIPDKSTRNTPLQVVLVLLGGKINPSSTIFRPNPDPNPT